MAALRIFGCLGFREGVDGHIPLARSFRWLKVHDLLLNHSGEVVIGHWRVNQAAFVLHAALHERRLEV